MSFFAQLTNEGQKTQALTCKHSPATGIFLMDRLDKQAKTSAHTLINFFDEIS